MTLRPRAGGFCFHPTRPVPLSPRTAMRRFPAASLFSLLLATGVLGGCVHDAESAIEVRGEALSYVLAEQVQSVARGTTVNLADLAPFRWERLYVFAPGTSASIIRDSVRVAWPGLTRFVGSTMPDSV